jgi:predicted DCC family thiol-disulfide oxidoreductase YuxK
VSERAPIVFYDGACGFCNGSVQFVLRHERRGSGLRFATLEGPLGGRLRDAFPEAGSVDSIVYVDAWPPDGETRAHFKSGAALAVSRHLNAGWRIAGAVGQLFPRALRDGIYDLIARHRKQLGGPAACDLVDADTRRRFL